MNLELSRKTLTHQSTIGILLVDELFACFTLEPPTKVDGSVKPYAIPAGSYEIQMLKSERFDRIMPHLINVPGFDGILIHVGNYPKDTLGCILVGTQESADSVFHSAEAFTVLFRQLEDACKKGKVMIYVFDYEIPNLDGLAA